MFNNTYIIIFYFFHRYVFSKNLVDTDFGYRELRLQLVGIFQQYLFVLAYHSSCHILHVVLLYMGMGSAAFASPLNVLCLPQRHCLSLPHDQQLLPSPLLSRASRLPCTLSSVALLFSKPQCS